jgi:hypothetical protein
MVQDIWMCFYPLKRDSVSGWSTWISKAMHVAKGFLNAISRLNPLIDVRLVNSGILVVHDLLGHTLRCDR